MSVDPYGTDVLLSNEGDLQVTPSGGLATITGPLNCAQALLLRLRTTPGELLLHPEYGSRLLARLGQKNLDDALNGAVAANELRLIVAADRRFLSARNLTVTTPAATPDRPVMSVDLFLAAGDLLQIASADPRLDEITVGTPPTLAELSGEPLDQLDTVEVFVDPDAELPELADLIRDESFTIEPGLTNG